MCLIILAWKVDPRRDLVVAANRDEYYERPTEAADFWSNKKDDRHGNSPTILGARDLRSGGTALAVHARNGRFAAVTNIRSVAATASPKANSSNPPSRGLLVTRFLEADEDTTPEAFLRELSRTADQYEGFNLLVADWDSCWHYSNAAYENTTHPQKLEPGAVYGLSNHHTVDPVFGWPKVAKGKAALRRYLDSTSTNDSRTTQQEQRDKHRECLFQAMSDQKTEPEDSNLPTEITGYSVEIERALSPIFVQIGTEYGTRSTTILERCRDDDDDPTTTTTTTTSAKAATTTTTTTMKKKMTTHYCERTYSSSGKAEQTLDYKFSSTVKT